MWEEQLELERSNEEWGSEELERSEKEETGNERGEVRGRATRTEQCD